MSSYFQKVDSSHCLSSKSISLLNHGFLINKVLQHPHLRGNVALSVYCASARVSSLGYLIMPVIADFL